MTNQVESTNVAVLGATGYIGRSLLASADSFGFKAVPVSRDKERAKRVFESYKIKADYIYDYVELLEIEHPVLINATGIGSPREIMKDPKRVMIVTEEMDAVIVAYLEKYPRTRVFSISSGSVYGLSAREPITDVSSAVFDINNLKAGDYYSLAKLYSEVRHRSLTESAIVDLRVFAFVSRWLDLNESFFVTEVARCLLEKKTMETMPNEMIRDYSNQDDIWNIVRFLISQPILNSAFDIKTKSPVTKFDLLNHMKEVFNLDFLVSENVAEQSPTGQKNAYYPESTKLTELGYVSDRTSLENVTKEMREFLASTE